MTQSHVKILLKWMSSVMWKRTLMFFVIDSSKEKR